MQTSKNWSQCSMAGLVSETPLDSPRPRSRLASRQIKFPRGSAMLSRSRYLKGHIEDCLVYSADQAHTFLSPQAIFSITVIVASGAALFVSWRAYHLSAKSTGPDMELVRRFVESAPLERLAEIQTPENQGVSQVEDEDEERKDTRL